MKSQTSPRALFVPLSGIPLVGGILVPLYGIPPSSSNYRDGRSGTSRCDFEDPAEAKRKRERHPMNGQTISHYRILENPPTTSRKNGTPPGQVGEGGMSQNFLRTLPMSSRNFEDPPLFGGGVVYKVPKSPTSASQQVAVILRTQRSLKW